MAFRFKQFTIHDQKSTMRVGTDSMLLGSWADPANSDRILDIGSGCGILALMLAQRSDALIDAAELDVPSADESAINFLNSPWNTRIRLHRCNIMDFREKEPHCYDYIISNPPFFKDSLRSPCHRKNLARHDHELSWSDLISLASRLLSGTGTLGLVMPATSLNEVTSLCLQNNLHPKRILEVRTFFNRPPVRVLAEFGADPTIACTLNELVIRQPDGSYTDDYLKLTQEFHSF